MAVFTPPTIQFKRSITAGNKPTTADLLVGEIAVNLRDRIIYSILKAYWKVTGEKLPIYYREEISLVIYAMTKEDKKKLGPKDIKGKYVLHNDESYQ